MLTDLQIAQSCKLAPLEEIAAKIDIPAEYLIPWGSHKAKVDPSVLQLFSDRKPGKLILVTTTNPTQYGEGKTTMVVGLAQGLAKLGKRVSLALREPSMGPVMGMKGGAAGGGYSQVLPMEDINLHFTGDLHAITAANNLLSAMIDNQMHFLNRGCFDEREIVWKRVMDMNDRCLRNIVVGLGGRKDGTPREDGFDITAASEIMAVLCLSKDFHDLKERLDRLVVAYGKTTGKLTAKDIGATGAMAVLLKDAYKPNLVQTVEGVPAFVHGGPFANIAHGTNSLISTRIGMAASDYFLVEAGFGSDLGAEKFFNIVCRTGGLKPSAVVMVATIRSLKKHGGFKPKGGGKDGLDALGYGMANLRKHLEIVMSFGMPVVVGVNKFESDTPEEVQMVVEMLEGIGVPVAVSEHHAKGGEGAVELARKLLDVAGEGREPMYTYAVEQTLEEKISAICTRIYGASSVSYAFTAKKQLAELEELGFGNLLVCMAKTQYSLSDDPEKLNVPRRFKMKIGEVRLKAGAGFIVPITGEITTMPGLPSAPAAARMSIDDDGRITGLF